MIGHWEITVAGWEPCDCGIGHNHPADPEETPGADK